MRSWVYGIALLTVTSAASLRAQGAASCQLVLADACQKAEDLYSYLFPQLGTALAGGHPVLGSGDVLGGLGHFSVGLRVTAVRGSFVDPTRVSVSTTGRVASTIATEDQYIPAPALDAAIGLFSGFEVGVTHIGGLDALLSFSYLPAPSSDNSVYELPDGSKRIGIGGRLGVLEESILIPGITFAVLRRPIPTITARSSTGSTSYGVENLEIDVNTWRVVATKSFLSFALSGGIGGDTYESSGFAVASDPSLTTQTERIALDRSVKRRTWFAGISFGLGPVQVGAEYGGVSSGSIATFNTFDPTGDSPRNYASVALRFGR